MENKKKCLIVDGNNLVYRSYYASQKLSWLGETKEIYVFLKIFLGILKKNDYRKVFVAFDEGKSTFRNVLNLEYKKNRDKTPALLIKNIKDVKILLTKININHSSNGMYEADDLIASFVKKFRKKNEYEFHIFSQDKDLFQLLSENTKILRYENKSLELFDNNAFVKANGFDNQRFIYYLSLTGDKSDNVKGIKGIGEKRAKYLVSRFKNLEQIFLNINSIPEEIKMLIKGKKEDIEKNIKIISLKEDFSLDSWESYNFSWKKLKFNEELIEFCQNNRMSSILRLIGTQSRTRTDTE